MFINYNPLQNRRASERFIKPALPTPMLGLNTSAPNVLTTTNPLLATGSAAIYGVIAPTAPTVTAPPAACVGGVGMAGFLSNLSSERLSLAGAGGGGAAGMGAGSGVGVGAGAGTAAGTFLAGGILSLNNQLTGAGGTSSSASSSSTNLLMNHQNTTSSGNLMNSSSSNSSLSGLSAFTPTNPPSAAATAFIQPASPMDTSTCKD